MKKFFLLMGGVIVYALTLTSPDFKEKISIEQVYYACGGKNISPTLFFGNIPKNAKSLAITMFDPDAPTPHGWWHWIVVNIPPNIKEFPKDAGNPESKYFNLGFQTINDYGEIGYGGPCPPPGKPHRYIITLYALDVGRFDVNRDISPQVLAEAIESHTIEKVSIIGYYARGWK
jgi:Raf kinase inhibitor-like YbhB/YbcL family protein